MDNDTDFQIFGTYDPLKIDIYVINLKERIDKWNHMCRTFHMFNLIRVEGVRNANTSLGCFLSHKKCIQYAKDNNMKHILIMEDDCIPFDNMNNRNFSERLTNIKKTYLDKNDDWNIFMPGASLLSTHDIKSNIVKQFKIENEYFFEIKKAVLFHCVSFNNTIYDFYLNFTINDKVNSVFSPDYIWMKHTTAIVPVPLLFVQKAGINDRLNIYVDMSVMSNLTNDTLSRELDNTTK